MSILDMFFPKKCVGCRKLGDFVCANCFTTISFEISMICLACGKPSLDGLTHPGCRKLYTIEGSFCGVVYKGVVKKLLYQFKYQPYLSGLKEFLGELLYESLVQQELFAHVLQEKPVLIPIPLSKKRLRQRGYNQAALLAAEMAKRFDLEVTEVLKRAKETKPQYGLKKEERAVNIKNAFSYSSSDPAPAGELRSLKGDSSRQARTITTALIIDDVLTTGSTLLEAANVLKRNGFTKVYGVTLARDQREN